MDRKILTYHDLIKIKAGENNEPMVDLMDKVPEIICRYEKMDMTDYLGEKIYTRQSLAELLAKASLRLKAKYPDYSFKVVYGYRHPEIQQKYFDKRKAELKEEKPNLSDQELSELAHLFVAAPEVAGHIVGGAVDLTITSSDGDLDMGTKIADFSEAEKIQTFFDGLTVEQKKNRKLLHDLMLEQGLAPFYGEWWHFCYGDKEWAAFYGKSKSLYSALDFRL